MSAAAGELLLGFLLTVFVVSVFVAVVAIRDCIARGDRQIRDAQEQWEQWEAARNITGRIGR